MAVRYSACLSTLTDVAVAGEKENQRSVCCHWVNCLFEQGNPGARKGLNALSEKARIFQTLPRERQPKKMSNKIKNNTKIIPEKKGKIKYSIYHFINFFFLSLFPLLQGICQAHACKQGKDSQTTEIQTCQSKPGNDVATHFSPLAYH